MEFFKHNTHIDFMGVRKWAGALSITTAFLAIVALAVFHLNFSFEFTGGTEVHVTFPQAADIPKVREVLRTEGFQDVIVQTYGPATNIMIRLSGKQNVTESNLAADITRMLPDATVLRVSYIGPQVGEELATNGALALFIAMLGTAIYIALRFEYRLAVSAAVSLIHDPLIILGFFAVTGLEFDLISLAAVLTIIGYSLNDTIVVFDRMRENFRKVRKATAAEIVNLSVNETLSRTIITSGLTLLAVLSLFLFGGEVLHSFSTVLLIGIVVGTYSSIYVAGALAVALGLKREDLLPTPKEALDNRP